MNITENTYINLRTGEKTHDHHVAVGWYRDGDSVSVYLHGAHKITWVV